MNASALISGFLSYLVLMIITIGFAFACGFIARQIKKRNNKKKDK